MTPAFEIRDAESPADRAAVQTLLRSAFEVRPGVGAAFAQVYFNVLARPPAHSRIAVIDGCVVGHTLLACRPFDIDGARIAGGIVAMVAVDAAWRRRGIGTALVQDAAQLARNLKVQMLHLAGDPRFYMRFGFVPGYVQSIAELPVSTGGDGGDLKRAALADVETLVRLSAMEHPAGAAVADAARWHWVLATKHPASLLFCNDQLLGFYAEDDACLMLGTGAFVRLCHGARTLAVYEAAAADARAADDMFNAVHRWARANGCVRMALHLPPGNRLMQVALARGASLRVSEDAELLVQVLDAPGMVRQMRAVLAQRAMQTQWAGALELRVGNHLFGVFSDGQTVTFDTLNEGWRLSLPEMGLVRALLGTDRLADRIGQGQEALKQDLDILFPARDPFFWLADSL